MAPCDTGRLAPRAGFSRRGHARAVSDSSAWLMQSKPLDATTFRGKVAVTFGSISATVGIRRREMMPVLALISVRLKIEMPVISEPVPDVVGQAMCGSQRAGNPLSGTDRRVDVSHEFGRMRGVQIRRLAGVDAPSRRRPRRSRRICPRRRSATPPGTMPSSARPSPRRRSPRRSRGGERRPAPSPGARSSSSVLSVNSATRFSPRSRACAPASARQPAPKVNVGMPTVNALSLSAVSAKSVWQQDSSNLLYASRLPRASGIAQDQIGRLFGDHDRRARWCCPTSGSA